jgi:SHS2 domain-containing protein
MFEILEHTADIGFRAQAGTLQELFAESAAALVAIAMEPDYIADRLAYPLAASGIDRESLLVNWLNEVLYWVDGERVAFNRFEFQEFTPVLVRATGFGEPRDHLRHTPRLVVKGVTYHQLQVASDATGWSARVYLDI